MRDSTLTFRDFMVTKHALLAIHHRLAGAAGLTWD